MPSALSVEPGKAQRKEERVLTSSKYAPSLLMLPQQSPVSKLQTLPLYYSQSIPEQDTKKQKQPVADVFNIQRYS